MIGRVGDGACEVYDKERLAEGRWRESWTHHPGTCGLAVQSVLLSARTWGSGMCAGAPTTQIRAVEYQFEYQEPHVPAVGACGRVHLPPSTCGFSPPLFLWDSNSVPRLYMPPRAANKFLQSSFSSLPWLTSRLASKQIYRENIKIKIIIKKQKYLQRTVLWSRIGAFTIFTLQLHCIANQSDKGPHHHFYQTKNYWKVWKGQLYILVNWGNNWVFVTDLTHNMLITSEHQSCYVGTNVCSIFLFPVLTFLSQYSFWIAIEFPSLWQHSLKANTFLSIVSPWPNLRTFIHTSSFFILRSLV